MSEKSALQKTKLKWILDRSATSRGSEGFPPPNLCRVCMSCALLSMQEDATPGVAHFGAIEVADLGSATYCEVDVQVCGYSFHLPW